LQNRTLRCTPNQHQYRYIDHAANGTTVNRTTSTLVRIQSTSSLFNSCRWTLVRIVIIVVMIQFLSMTISVLAAVSTNRISLLLPVFCLSVPKLSFQLHSQQHRSPSSTTKRRCCFVSTRLYDNDNNCRYRQHESNASDFDATTTSTGSCMTPNVVVSRRTVWTTTISLVGAVVVTNTVLLPAGTVNAAMINNPFDLSKNPWHKNDPFVDQVQRLEQAQVEQVRYLQEENAKYQTIASEYPTRLVPILSIAQDITDLYQFLVVVRTPQQQNTTSTTDSTIQQGVTTSTYQRAMNILSNSSRYDTTSFKRVFNAYTDVVYYSDPEHAKTYWGGTGGTYLHVLRYCFICCTSGSLIYFFQFYLVCTLCVCVTTAYWFTPS
jgi:hypothetical protein